ncbi:hypothetical protein HELRODRAFT_67963 [Helobdella robusta]|uniref:PWWP domain-containing protein n=1 Tax=Helobdella robusta TaxID=6412 RepID=T1FZ85_HELRO|nr:hypothetical protein HELRODRAFT_67963 [Helobdella robusta]ESN96185.1 hypothetical protein HELRODRAFT_67963 [Helobdella robusta]
MESASKLPLDTLTIPSLTPTHKPLKETFETLVKWSIGDMFWARVTGHPWWPCMIYKDPTNLLFTKMIRVNRGYHFHFFGNNSERGWVLEPSMIQFEGKEKFEEHRKEKLDQANRMVAKSVSEKITKIALQSFEIKPHRLEAWNEAVEEAARVFLMPVEERIKYVEEILSKNKTKDSPKKSKSKLTSTSLVGGVAMKRKHEDDVAEEVAGDGDANESNSEGIILHFSFFYVNISLI